MLGAVIAALQFRDRTGSSCVRDNGFCPDWIVHNFSDRYLGPLGEHVALTLLSVTAGFVIAFGLALLAYRRRRLIAPITGVTGVMYTVPSLALFFLLQPISGRGTLTAVIALTSYSLLIIFRNVIIGLDNVSGATTDAARGQGLTERQILWRVQLPLALPEIIAGLRVASTTVVGLATLAFFAGAGGLGGQIFADLTFKSNVITVGGLCVALAATLDLVLLGVQRVASPWSRARST